MLVSTYAFSFKTYKLYKKKPKSQDHLIKVLCDFLAVSHNVFFIYINSINDLQTYIQDTKPGKSTWCGKN